MTLKINNLEYSWFSELLYWCIYSCISILLACVDLFDLAEALFRQKKNNKQLNVIWLQYVAFIVTWLAIYSWFDFEMIYPFRFLFQWKVAKVWIRMQAAAMQTHHTPVTRTKTDYFIISIKAQWYHLCFFVDGDKNNKSYRRIGTREH